MIKDRLGQPIYGTNTHFLDSKLDEPELGSIVEYSFAFNMNLGVGSYSLAIALHSSGSHLKDNFEWLDMALVYNVVNTEHKEFIGVAWIPPVVELIE